MKIFQGMVLSISLLATNAYGGTWIHGKDIYQVEARNGHQISVIVNDTNNLCQSNRIYFGGATWVSQDGVNQYFSMLLAARVSRSKVSIYVERASEGATCYGRIAYI